VKIWFHTFFTWATDGDESSASRSGLFRSGRRAPGTHWIGGWVEPRAGLNAAEKRIISSVVGHRTPFQYLPDSYLVTIPTEKSRRPGAETKRHKRIMYGDLKETGQLEDLDVDGRKY
jgi:hypothetical protein